MKAKKKSLGSTIKPVGEMVLVYHDQDQSVTAGGIHLPNISEVKVLTGRIAALPKRMEEDTLQYPFEVADHIIYDIRDRIPVELMPGNRYFLVDARFIYGVVSSGEEDDDE